MEHGCISWEPQPLPSKHGAWMVMNWGRPERCSMPLRTLVYQRIDDYVDLLRSGSIRNRVEAIQNLVIVAEWKESSALRLRVVDALGSALALDDSETVRMEADRCLRQIRGEWPLDDVGNVGEPFGSEMSF
jgi:hypothetical protein